MAPNHLGVERVPQVTEPVTILNDNPNRPLDLRRTGPSGTIWEMLGTLLRQCSDRAASIASPLRVFVGGTAVRYGGGGLESVGDRT